MPPRRRPLLLAAAALLAAGLGLGWWLSQAPAPEAPPDRAETEEMMREIGYVQ
jgi:hypothetical protein